MSSPISYFQLSKVSPIPQRLRVWWLLVAEPRDVYCELTEPMDGENRLLVIDEPVELEE